MEKAQVRGTLHWIRPLQIWIPTLHSLILSTTLMIKTWWILLQPSLLHVSGKNNCWLLTWSLSGICNALLPWFCCWTRQHAADNRCHQRVGIMGWWNTPKDKLCAAGFQKLQRGHILPSQNKEKDKISCMDSNPADLSDIIHTSARFAQQWGMNARGWEPENGKFVLLMFT